MNANLKEVMRNAGYPATDGDNWLGQDTRTFQDFAVHVLGAPLSQTTQFLTHPQAFPELLERLAALGVPEVEPVPEPEIEQPEEQDEPEGEQTEDAPEDQAPPGDAPLDLSAPDQAPVQSLESQFASTEDTAPAGNETAEGAAADAPEGQAPQDDEPPADAEGSELDGAEGADEEE